MNTRKPLTRQQVLDDLARRGISISKWARDHGFNPGTVVHVLNGRRGSRFGQGHKIAVMLGLKDGVIDEEGDGRHAA